MQGIADIWVTEVVGTAFPAHHFPFLAPDTYCTISYRYSVDTVPPGALLEQELSTVLTRVIEVKSCPPVSEVPGGCASRD